MFWVSRSRRWAGEQKVLGGEQPDTHAGAPKGSQWCSSFCLLQVLAIQLSLLALMYKE